MSDSDGDIISEPSCSILAPPARKRQRDSDGDIIIEPSCSILAPPARKRQRRPIALEPSQEMGLLRNGGDLLIAIVGCRERGLHFTRSVSQRNRILMFLQNKYMEGDPFDLVKPEFLKDISTEADQQFIGLVVVDKWSFVNELHDSVGKILEILM